MALLSFVSVFRRCDLLHQGQQGQSARISSLHMKRHQRWNTTLNLLAWLTSNEMHFSIAARALSYCSSL